MSNALVQLRRLLPPSPVLLGTVVEIHSSDDTSTIELPVDIGSTDYAAGVSTGPRLRVRGTSVAVGERACVRDGVIESRGPDGAVVEVTIGQQVSPPADMVFSGPIPDQSWGVGEVVSYSVAGFFSSPFSPLTFAVSTGTLPAGLALNADTGLISGARTNATASSVAITAKDAELRSASSNAFDV